MSEGMGNALRALVTEIVREALPLVLAEVGPQLAAKNDDALMFVADAPALGISPNMLATAIRAGKVPGLKIGRRLAAKRSDVLAWRASRPFKPRARTRLDLDPRADLAADLDSAFAALKGDTA